MKNALILCAGSARRLFGNGQNSPKCLLPLTANSVILDQLIQPLQTREYNVILGTGCRHDLVAAHAEQYSGVRCIYNPDYQSTNSIVTLWLLRDFVTDSTLLINGDLVVDESTFDAFTEEATPQILTQRITEFDADSYRVVFDEHHAAVRMGKDIDDAPAANCTAFTGISRVGNANRFLGEIEKLLQSGTNDTWPTTAYRNLIGEMPVRVHVMEEMLFFDVDTPEEFEAAKAALA
jgi:2-aminoethylphosphonate-pyruvate transaminase